MELSGILFLLSVNIILFLRDHLSIDINVTLHTPNPVTTHWLDKGEFNSCHSVAATKETIELCNGSPESTARAENTNASPELL